MNFEPPDSRRREGYKKGLHSMVRISALRAFLTLLVLLTIRAAVASGDDQPWKKHVVHEGIHTNTAIAADFTGDRRPDVISNSGGKTRLFVAPDWKELILDDTLNYDFIHSETFDIDRDGDGDWIGARYAPGLVVWLEQP